MAVEWCNMKGRSFSELLEWLTNEIVFFHDVCFCASLAAELKGILFLLLLFYQDLLISACLFYSFVVCFILERVPE